MFNKKFFLNGTDAQQNFSGSGSFGELSGTLTRDENAISISKPAFKMSCNYKQDAHGVFTRNDVFENKSEESVTIYNLKSRFVFDGGEYEVYTQFNNWQTESVGQWQPLTTCVSVSGDSVRTCMNGAPFVVLWSVQEQRGTAFHLLPNCSWEIKISKLGTHGKRTNVVVELGISDFNLSLAVDPGETVKLPEILCYEVKNKVHFDCYKLHNYMHTNYPRKTVPVIYDTWMYQFDHISYESVVRQIPLAADLGVEYFFIDAGWFGKGASWGSSVGDWSENTTSAFKGRMLELANEVRNAGMKFGIWLEPERANINSDAVREHPDFYIPTSEGSSNLLLDFGNAEARKWMLGVIFDLIDHYGVEYIKDDFNADLFFDKNHGAFLEYHKGHEEFVHAIRERYPNIYLSSCASGGLRVELENYKLFDSSWPSDNESPYDEMEMYKHSIRRMPPQALERWAAIHSLGGFEDFYKSFAECNKDNNERIVACGDAIWSHVVGVKESYLKGFFTGGPIGFSCDLALVSEKTRAAFKEFIAKYKENREFWRTAVARLLCDTNTITVYQYSDMALNKAVIQLFTNDTIQKKCCVHPELDAAKYYRINGEEVRSGAEIQEEGIDIVLHTDWDDHYPMFQVELEVVDAI